MFEQLDSVCKLTEKWCRDVKATGVCMELAVSSIGLAIDTMAALYGFDAAEISQKLADACKNINEELGAFEVDQDNS